MPINNIQSNSFIPKFIHNFYWQVTSHLAKIITGIFSSTIQVTTFNINSKSGDNKKIKQPENRVLHLRALLKKITAVSAPSILCLQQVDTKDLFDKLKGELATKTKTILPDHFDFCAPVTGTDNSTDCVIAWDRNRFHLIERNYIEFDNQYLPIVFLQENKFLGKVVKVVSANIPSCVNTSNSKRNYLETIHNTIDQYEIDTEKLSFVRKIFYNMQQKTDIFIGMSSYISSDCISVSHNKNWERGLEKTSRKSFYSKTMVNADNKPSSDGPTRKIELLDPEINIINPSDHLPITCRVS